MFEQKKKRTRQRYQWKVQVLLDLQISPGPLAIMSRYLVMDHLRVIPSFPMPDVSRDEPLDLAMFNLT